MEPWITVVNGAAGGGRCAKLAQNALFELREKGLVLVTHETSGQGDATRIVRQAYHDGARRFLSVGGDGTHYEVVNGLFPMTGTPAVLGMLPLGTGNSFLRDFDVADLQAGAQALTDGSPTPIDVIKVTHTGGELHYINLLSVGFPAAAGALTNLRFKPFGKAGYVMSVLMSLARLEHPVIPLRLDAGDDDRRPCTLLSFSNSRYTGGRMLMAPKADVADGALDVIRVGPIGRGRLLSSFPKIFAGTHENMETFEHRQVKRVDFDLDAPVDVMVDGEVLALSLESLEVLPGALQVMA